MSERVRLTARLAADTKDKPKKGDVHRDIPKDIEYDKSKVKHIKKILHNISVAVGNLTGATKEFSLIKGPDISPDGLLGGRGYIKSIRDIKDTLSLSVHSLADLADTLVDELNNPKWELKEKEQKEIEEEQEGIQEQAEEVDEAVSESDPDPAAKEETEADPDSDAEDAEAEAEAEETTEEVAEETEADPKAESEAEPGEIFEETSEEEVTKESSDEISASDIKDSPEVMQDKEARKLEESVAKYMSSAEEAVQMVLSRKVLANLLRKV